MSVLFLGWAHVVCALYIPEVRFGNVGTMEPIVFSSVPHERFMKVNMLDISCVFYNRTVLLMFEAAHVYTFVTSSSEYMLCVCTKNMFLCKKPFHMT